MQMDKKDIQDFEDDMSKILDGQEKRITSKIGESIEELAVSINKEFIRISDRFEVAHERVNKLEKTIKNGFTKVNETLYTHSTKLDNQHEEFAKIEDEIKHLTVRVNTIERIVKASHENDSKGEKKVMEKERKEVEAHIGNLVEGQEYLKEGLSEIRTILMDLLNRDKENVKRHELEVIRDRVAELEKILLAQISS